MHRLAWTFALASASTCFASIASAQDASTTPLSAPSLPSEPPPAADDPNDWESTPRTRRSGFTVGTSFGLMGGASSGYRNKVSEVGNPAYRASVNGLGGGGFIWLGGAFTDWFNFGIGGGGGNFGNADFQWSGGAFIFHIEAFPLFSLGEGWRDVGVSFDFGTGPGTIVRKSDNEEVSGDGTLSLAGMGLFWEPWRIAGGHLTAGPAISFLYGFTEWQKTSVGMVGLRGAFYGGP